MRDNAEKADPQQRKQQFHTHMAMDGLVAKETERRGRGRKGHGASWSERRGEGEKDPSSSQHMHNKCKKQRFSKHSKIDVHVWHLIFLCTPIHFCGSSALCMGA